MKKILKAATSAAALTIAAAGLAIATPASAALIAKVSFDQPFAVVASNVPIDVYVTLSLDPASDALSTDATGTVTSGFDAMGYSGPINLADPNTRIVLNNGFSCSGNFGTPCISGPPYDFAFNGPGSLIGITNFNLAPGGSYSYLFGTFTPTNGDAPAGIYRFYDMIPEIQLFNPGPDLGDPSDDQYDFIGFAHTCQDQNDSCAFTREVFAVNTAVPEPATWAMLIFGFGLAGVSLRRRDATRAASLV